MERNMKDWLLLILEQEILAADTYSHELVKSAVNFDIKELEKV